MLGARNQHPRKGSGSPSIVFFLDNLSIGGTELSALRMARYFDPRKVRLRVICLRSDGPLRKEFERLGVDVTELPIRGLASWEAARATRTLFGLLRKWRVDVFHAFDPYTNILGLPVARAASVPLVVASHRWWRRVHHSRLDRANRYAIRFAHRLVANSPRVAELAVEQGMPAGRVMTVPNFVEPELLESPGPEWITEGRQALGIPEGCEVIGCVANLRALKGHRTLLGAFGRLVREGANLHLVLVGDGEEREPLEAAARGLGILDRVHFAGRRPNVPNPHHLFDVSVLCSTTEAFPNSLLEAMAASRPVVASRVGGIPDAVEHGVTGYLFTPGDEDELAEHLRNLVADGALRSHLGAAGNHRVRTQFASGPAMRALLFAYGVQENASTETASPTTLPERGWRERARATSVTQGAE